MKSVNSPGLKTLESQLNITRIMSLEILPNTLVSGETSAKISDIINIFKKAISHNWVEFPDCEQNPDGYVEYVYVSNRYVWVAYVWVEFGIITKLEIRKYYRPARLTEEYKAKILFELVTYNKDVINKLKWWDDNTIDPCSEVDEQ